MAHPQGKVKAEGEDPSSPKVKQEPAETRVPLDLPDAKRSQVHGNSQLLYRPPKLPFRPPNSEDGCKFEPPAETISWQDSPPFPRALYRPDSLADFSSRKPSNSLEHGDSRESAESSSQLVHYFDRDRPAKRMRSRRREGRHNPAMSAPPGGRQLRGIVPIGLNMSSQPPANAANVDTNTVPTAAPTQPRTQPSAPIHRASNAPTATPTQLLSLECQRRRFNPHWIMREKGDGTFSCAVKLLYHTVSSKQTYPSLLAAKYAIAEKALEEIQNWPTAADVARENCMNHLERTRVNQEYRVPPRAAKPEEDVVMANVTAAGAREGRASRPAGRAHDLDRAAEQAGLVEEVRRMTRGAVPDSVLDYPESTRMYLEGLLAGARLFHLALRSRSRSPDPVYRSSSYRERSPPSGLVRPRSPTARRALPSVEGLCYSDTEEPTAVRPALPPPDYYPRRRASTDRYRPEYHQRPVEKEWPHDKFRP